MNDFLYGRSPLNIVHAGLDIIRADMRPMEEGSSLVVVSTENAEMIEQIFTASQTAIEILDDLLQYEHIDSGRQIICDWRNALSVFYSLLFTASISGSFTLERAWRPVANFLEGKLDWIRMLALRSHVEVTIDDGTIAFAGGIPILLTT